MLPTDDLPAGPAPRRCVRGPRRTTVHLLRSLVNAAASGIKGSLGQDTWHGVA
ncbi:hypothetical protein [Streptomyces violaceorubidus]|uniref:Transposase n=1 Tax=Streptomyces violaceorubidus TaxID=284042 RepID=A0ABV1SVQ2_9ACTN